MHGTPLTPQEAVAAVARNVRRLEAQGLNRDHAIRRAAAENGIEPHKARWCAETAGGGPSARTPERDHGRVHAALTSGPPSKRRGRWRAGLAAPLAATALALASAGGAQAATINVSPAGSDANPGTAAAPLKTLGKALSKAGAGDTVKLAGGGYGQGPSGNGEQIPQSGLVVPSGVRIEGATENGFPVATLLGQGGGVGLRFAGNATVRNLFVGGGPGFAVGIYAKQGTQTLGNLFIAVPGGTASIDGTPLSGGIVLRGAARATLLAGAAQANTTGSTLFVNRGQGASVLEQARLTMRGGQINTNGTSGVRAGQQGRITMDGGKIVGAAAGNCPTGSGIVIADSAQATLKNQAALTNLATALTAGGTSKATVSGAVITKESRPGCAEFPSVDAEGSAALALDGTTIATIGGQHTVGIRTSHEVTLGLKDTDVHGHTRAGIDIGGDPTIGIDGGSISGNAIGIRHRVSGLPKITVARAFFAQNDIAMQVTEPMLKVRTSKIILNRIGIEVRGDVGGLPTRNASAACAGPCVNLGTDRALPGPTPFDDPGNNNLSANRETAVDLTFASGHVPAVGNLWNANTQGANGDGLYPQPLTLNGSSPHAAGSNFRLTPFNQMTLGTNPVVVGTFQLNPRNLTAWPGQPVSWRLAWTHPVHWKRLDQIVLRLASRGKPVGRVVLDQETRHLRAVGPAVRLVPGRSAVAANGKRVTATLALRVASRYAGRTLIAKVAATDDGGRRQGFRKAGRVRVLAR